jgi:hypothetical protein
MVIIEGHKEDERLNPFVHDRLAQRRFRRKPF